MAEFAVQVFEVTSVEPIPGADRIELAVVLDYRSVVSKGAVEAGTRVVYIPEASIVPDAILTDLNLVGKLSGPQHNRVKAAKFKGCLSQGLIWIPEWINECQLGQDVTERTGITKYEPQIPGNMGGSIRQWTPPPGVKGTGGLLHYDIENIKKWPDIIEEGTPCTFQEKVHGTLVQIMYMPGIPEEISFDGFAIASKGLGARGFCFQNNEENNNNLYIRTLREEKILDKILSYTGLKQLQNPFYQYPELADDSDQPIYFFGEIYGKGVQDLHYGTDKAKFGLFDIYVGRKDHGVWLLQCETALVAERCGIPTLPYLYEGPFSKPILELFTNGKETVSGTSANVREGVVIRTDRTHPKLGRVILKSVSADYLLRKGETTEYA